MLNLEKSEFVTIEYIKNVLQVSQSTVYSLLKKGEIKNCRVGAQYRIPRSSFEEYIKRISCEFN